MIQILIKNHYLLRQMAKKDITDRYKGSSLGMIWAFLVPIFMLIIYTFVFSEVFQAKWGNAVDSKFDFAMILYCGLSVFNILSDVAARSTGLIAGNVNYVKKVVFPLEILPVMETITALFHASISYLILVTMNLALNHTVSSYLWLWPVAILPAIILVLGIGYLISALSVFIKDLANVISVIITVLMYTSPVFYSSKVVPESIRSILFWNPMTYIIENLRNVVIYNQSIDWGSYAISWIYATVFLMVGYFVFSRTKEGFADVL